jgi:PPPDE putative peptidase domain
MSTYLNFRPETYSAINNNCHCFAQELSKLLGGEDLPDWVTLPERYARAAGVCVCVIGLATAALGSSFFRR